MSQPSTNKDDEIQILTSLPNENRKHIDYVVVHQKFNPVEACTHRHLIKSEKKRKEFFIQLMRESFEIYNIEYEIDKKIYVFSLLHCSLERLMEEAEAIRLEVKLKNCKFLSERGHQLKIFQFFQKLIRKPLKSETGNSVSAQFEKSIKFMFEGCDDAVKGPFNNTLRILLADSILSNLTFATDKNVAKFKFDQYIQDVVYRNLALETDVVKDTNVHSSLIAKTKPPTSTTTSYDPENVSNSKIVYRGLQYMLEKGYFRDAFVLHDESQHYMNLKYLFKNTAKSSLFTPFEIMYKNFSTFDHLRNSDVRLKLNNTWAAFANTFRHQPMEEIRTYFGESNAIYFAWLGVFISLLWFPTIIGFLFFIVGISTDWKSKRNHTIFTNASSSSFTARYFSNSFTNSFDNEWMPYFSVLLCLWGAVFTENWKRENARLAFEWDVDYFEHYESDLPDYIINRKKASRSRSQLRKFMWRYEKYWKSFISIMISMLMIGIVAVDTGLVIVFRMFIKIKVFPDNIGLKLIFGDLCSILINTCFIMVLNIVYKKIAKVLTKWENHRTKTEYDDSLIFKLFAFEFVNNYASLFYLAYFRNIDFEKGLFNLGAEFKDTCEDNDCMPLLTTQLVINLLIKPMPRFVTAFIYPLINKFYNDALENKELISLKRDVLNQTNKTMNEKAVLLYVNIERNKVKFNDTINEEYNEKIILYGYVLIFSASFSLAPLIVLLINLIDLRIDANRLLWLYRRPVGYKAQDIGSWFGICRFLNVVAIINNGFMVAFKSSYSRIYLNGDNYERFVFLTAFEYLTFFLWSLIIFFLPSTPHEVMKKSRQEAVFVKQLVSAAKMLKKEAVPSSNHIYDDEEEDDGDENNENLAKNEKNITDSNYQLVKTNQDVNDNSSSNKRRKKQSVQLAKMKKDSKIHPS